MGCYDRRQRTGNIADHIKVGPSHQTVDQRVHDLLNLVTQYAHTCRREGKGGQVWLTDWLSPKEYIQLGYRNAKVSKTFIPGGTTQNDINIRAVLRLKDDLELNAFGQAEFWKVPALASGSKNDFTGSFQLTYFPKMSWRK